MQKILMGSVVLVMLSACGGGVTSGATASDGNEAAVCDEQSRLAQSGKIGGGDIAITCPGNARPGY